MPTATPPDQVEAVLAEAVARPTLGARQLVWHLAERGVRLSPSGVQKILRRHRLGRRAQRVAALAQLTAATTGILTTDAKDGPFGFCHFAARPGDLVALDTFYVGKPRGHRPGLAVDGGRYRHPLCDRCPGRRGQVGPGRRQLRRPRRRTAGRHRGRAHRGADRQRPRVHRSHLHQPPRGARRPPPSHPAPLAQHNAVCERFQGTTLQEFYRPAFHRQHFARLADLNTQFQGWLQTYNTRRRNHGDFMRGRTPFAAMEAHLS